MRNVLVALVVSLLAAAASASTGFNVPAKNGTHHYGISSGWYTPARAALTLNPRNIERNGAIDASTTNAPVWTSRYWNVTQTMFGAGFPMSGVNEKGLIIQATILRDRPYPAPPARALVLQRSQWTQYHLDTSASLQEVIAKSVTGEHPVMPQSAINAQFQVCDVRDCAVISYYDDKVVAHGSIGRVEVDLASGAQKVDRANLFPWGTIANSLLSENIAAFEKPSADMNDSLARFNSVTSAVQGYAKGKVDLTRIFADLAKVDQHFPKTTWNEVYTVQQRGDRTSVRLSFKKPEAPMEQLQSIEVTPASFDVECGKPTTMWWIDMDRPGGDRSSEHFGYTREVQQVLAMQHAKENGGQFPRATLEPMVTAPETKTTCKKPHID
jgi:hypothetical protein